MYGDSDLDVPRLPTSPPPLPLVRMADNGPIAGRQYTDELVRCPYCGSTQFFGGKKVTALGWALYIMALVNVPISFLLMFLFIGFLTIFATPVLAIIGFYGCRQHVNTCARCKREF
jgi:hypothetical protein